jgi:hypothetical protein
MLVELVTGISGLGRSRLETKGKTKFNKLWYRANNDICFAGVGDFLWLGRLSL